MVMSTYSRKSKCAKKNTAVSKTVKKYVKSVMPKIEVKTAWFHDNEVSLSTLAQGAMQAYPLLANGPTKSQRIGNDIMLTEFEIKGSLKNNSATNTIYARALIVGHTGEIDPTIATFPIFQGNFDETTLPVSSVNGLDAMYFPINKKELTVYHDKVYKLAGDANGNDGKETVFFSKHIKFGPKGMKVSYKGNTSGYKNQTKMVSVVWIVAEASDDTTTGFTVELSQLTRYWFTDV